MSKTYKGSLSLEWYNKQQAVMLRGNEDVTLDTDIPAPRINWVNKDEALFYEIDPEVGIGQTPYWINRNDIRVKEARPLNLQKVFSALKESKPGTIDGMDTKWKISESTKDALEVENILIKGDNLLALNTIKKIFNNKQISDRIKCAYLDLPFNIDVANDNYDDNLAHSEWLTLIRDRLVLIYEMLREDGFVMLHIDDQEVAHLKLLCDGIFGRDNFINMICYERSGTAGIGQGGFFVDVAEYILFYAKNKSLAKFNTDIYEYEPLERDVMVRYNKILKNYGDKELMLEFKSKSNNESVKIYKHSNYEIETIPLGNFKERESEIRRSYLNNFNSIFRTTNPQKENVFQTELIQKMGKGLYSVEYTPSRGKYKDIKTTIPYHNQEIFAWLKDSAQLIDNDVVKTYKLSTVWPHKDIPKADLANEGGVEFKRSKKPEQLIKRILELCTQEGDWVLDSFAGSGTTLAVAHKMNRKWVGVEIGNHADTHIISRMKNVINGLDQSGISKLIAWQGGGSFKYYHLGQSIITINKDGSWDFNWNLGKRFIEESFLSSYDYKLDKSINISDGSLFPDETNIPLIGVQIIGSKRRVAVISLNEPKGKRDQLSYDEIFHIYSVIKKKLNPEYINIFTNKGLELAFDSKPDDLEIFKIPHAIFSELEK